MDPTVVNAPPHSESPSTTRQSGRWRRCVLVLLLWSVLLIIWTVALLTPDPVRFADAVLPKALEFPAAKTLHVASYALLAGLIGLMRPLGRYRWLLLAVLSLHGMGTEYFQQFVETRSPSVRDVILDHIGIVLGATLMWKNWLKSA